MGILIGAVVIVLAALGLQRQSAKEPRAAAAVSPTPEPAKQPIPVSPTLPTPRTDPPDSEPVQEPLGPSLDTIRAAWENEEPPPVIEPAPPPPIDPATLVSPSGSLEILPNMSIGGANDLMGVNWGAKLSSSATNGAFVDMKIRVMSRDYFSTTFSVGPGGSVKLWTRIGTGVLPGGSHPVTVTLRAKNSRDWIEVGTVTRTVTIPAYFGEGLSSWNAYLLACGMVSTGEITPARAYQRWLEYHHGKGTVNPEGLEPPNFDRCI